jgi:alanine dehydrogenase
MWGCGNQGKISVKMLAAVRDIKVVYLYDIDKSKADQLVSELKLELDIDLVAVVDPYQAIEDSDIIVTCTPSKAPLIRRSQVRPGTFIAAVGADSESKQELDPSLFKSTKVVVDLLEQSEKIGDLRHAIQQNVISRDDVFAELGEIVCGNKRGRESEEEIIIFDSTGMALQDVATASIVFKKAADKHIGLQLSFND